MFFKIREIVPQTLSPRYHEEQQCQIWHLNSQKKHEQPCQVWFLTLVQNLRPCQIWSLNTQKKYMGQRFEAKMFSPLAGTSTRTDTTVYQVPGIPCMMLRSIIYMARVGSPIFRKDTQATCTLFGGQVLSTTTTTRAALPALA